MGCFLSGILNIFNYKGRATRDEFGLFVVLALLIQLGFYVLNVITDDILFILQVDIDIQIWAKFVVGCVHFISILICYLALLSVRCRRLHDLGLSGWWQIIPITSLSSFIILIFWLMFVLSKEEAEMAGFGIAKMLFMPSILVMVVSSIFTLFLIFKRGQEQENKYGKSPEFTGKLSP